MDKNYLLTIWARDGSWVYIVTSDQFSAFVDALGAITGTDWVIIEGVFDTHGRQEVSARFRKDDIYAWQAREYLS